MVSILGQGSGGIGEVEPMLKENEVRGRLVLAFSASWFNDFKQRFFYMLRFILLGCRGIELFLTQKRSEQGYFEQVLF